MADVLISKEMPLINFGMTGETAIADSIFAENIRMHRHVLTLDL
jgi:hypothetical protein